MAETNTGKVLMAEQNRHAPPRAAPIKDHFCIRDTANERLRLQRRHGVAGLGTVADCVNGRLVEPCPPAVAEELAGFGVGTLG